MEVFMGVLECLNIITTTILGIYYTYKLMFTKLDQTDVIRYGFLAILCYLCNAL